MEVSSAGDAAARRPAAANALLEPDGPAESSPARWQDTVAYQHGRRDYFLRRALAAGDAVAVLCALVIATTIAGVRGPGELVWALPALPAAVALLAIYGLYDRDVKRINRSVLDELPSLFHALVIGTLLLWLYYRLVPPHQLVLAEVLAFIPASIVCISLLRLLVRRVAARMLGPERVLFVGEAPVSQALIRKMRTHPEFAIEPIGVICNHDGRSSLPLPVLGNVHAFDMGELAAQHDFERVIVAEVDIEDGLMGDVVQDCARFQIKVTVLPRYVETIGPSVEVDDIEGVTVLDLNPPVLPRSSRWRKRCMDVLGAGFGLLVLSPMLAVIAVAIKLDSRGPVFFRQTRIGRWGEPFTVLKFRTMVDDAEGQVAELMASSEDPNWLKLERDPRITRVGRVTRLTSLDELPQLWSVLVGKMSLVGPRPLIAAEDRLVEGRDRARLDLAPGITGLWQVMGRTSIPFEEMVKLDYTYVTNWSMWTDIKLLLRTLPTVVGRRGAN